MSKPILIIMLPKNASRKSAVRIQERLTERITDWHIIIAVGNSEEVQFKAFAEGLITEIEINDLREYIKNTIA